MFWGVQLLASKILKAFFAKIFSGFLEGLCCMQYTNIMPRHLSTHDKALSHLDASLRTITLIAYRQSSIDSHSNSKNF